MIVNHLIATWRTSWCRAPVIVAAAVVEDASEVAAWAAGVDGVTVYVLVACVDVTGAASVKDTTGQPNNQAQGEKNSQDSGKQSDAVTATAQNSPSMKVGSLGGQAPASLVPGPYTSPFRGLSVVQWYWSGL